MNVTTSANWDRPVVGIVRVERSLCGELKKLYGHQLKECIWHNDRFVERLPSHTSKSSNVEPPVRVDIKQTRTRQAWIGRLIRFLSLLRLTGKSYQCPENEPNGLRMGISSQDSLTPESKDPFAAGDVLISVGLDWDYPYHKKFYDLRRKRGIRVVTCCHDLIPILYPQHCVGHVASHFKQYVMDIASGSDLILCVSKQSERDLKLVLAEIGAAAPRTFVISHGDNVPTDQGDVSDKISEIAKTPFLLYVSTIERRKNHEVLYHAYHLLCEAGKKSVLPKLVFVGMPGWGVGDFLKDLELDPLTSGLIIQFHNVNDAELRCLYESALFCLYPSFYEGWGLPVGEALALGKVVLSSDRGPLPEVGGELVRYANPWNPVAWAEAIWILIHDKQNREAIENRVRTVYKPRKWEDTAATVKAAIDLMLNVEL